MFTTMLDVLAKSFARSGSQHVSAVRSRRTNRRFSFNEGIEGLEGRMAPSGGVATVTVTVTNQTDTSTSTSTTTDTGDGSDTSDGSDTGFGTVVGISPTQSTLSC
jgi:hypothetical protein